MAAGLLLLSPVMLTWALLLVLTKLHSRGAAAAEGQFAGNCNRIRSVDSMVTQ
jgi:hypothetical protein